MIKTPLLPLKATKGFGVVFHRGRWNNQSLITCSSSICVFVSLQIVVDKSNQPWVVYDAGPRHVHSPLVCLPPVCGTADVFFKQLLALSQAGYRVISVNCHSHYLTTGYVSVLQVSCWYRRTCKSWSLGMCIKLITCNLKDLPNTIRLQSKVCTLPCRWNIRCSGLLKSSVMGF